MQNYKIMVLGPSGSGKTVFLGSMYKQLAIQKEDIGFFLAAERRQELQLNAIYKQVVSPDEEWPRANQYRYVNQWQFSCNVRSARNIYPAFQFTYLDYSGERLTDIHFDDEIHSPEFEHALKEADIYLGLLDGRKVLEFMHEDNSEGSQYDKFVHIELPSILSVMQNRPKPVHFVITKWDLLEGKYTLTQVRNRLLEIPDFRNFVKIVAGESTIRLIPISSVGSHFAELLPDGQMRKKPSTFPQPFQVEMPMACALIDMFRDRLTALEKEYEQKSNLPLKEVKPDISKWKWVKLWTQRTAHYLLNNFPAIREIFDFEEETVNKILNLLKAEVESTNLDIQKRQVEAQRKADELNRQQKDSLKAVQDQKTAVEHVIDSFFTLIERLERDFPESTLS